MQKALVIAEKPDVKRKIESAYQNHTSEIPYAVDCLAMRGHLLRLKEPSEIDDKMIKWSFDTLPFNPDDYHGFETVLIDDADTKKRFYSIKQALESGNYDFIIHAGDPDQEGELLVRLVLNKLQNKLPVKRFWLNAQTESEYLQGLLTLRDDNEPMFVNLYHAALMRMQADYLLGMNGSRAAGIKFNLKGASVGRAVSAILNMIVTREEEIRNFVPKTEYGVSVTYGPTPFEGKYFEIVETTDNEGKKIKKEEYVYFPDESEAKDIISKIGNTATVTKTISQKKTIKAPKLYNLGDLQVDAAKKFGYASDCTLSIVQSLYDNQYLTYPRTDCNYISPEVDLKRLLDTAAIIPKGNIVDTITSADVNKVHNDKTYVNSSECAKHGHTAILITEKIPDLNSFTQEQRNVYILVAMRFISIFLPPLVQLNSTIYSKSGEYNFKSVGKSIQSLGFADFLGMNIKDTSIPIVNDNDILPIKSKQTSEKTSTCPKRFTESTIVEALNKPAPFLKDKSYKSLKDRLRIGTPATQASLIKKLKDKEYVLIKNNTFYPTDVGMAFARALRVSDIVDVDTTAIWETKLDSIRHGELEHLDFKREILVATDKMVNDIKGSSVSSVGADNSSGGSTPVAVCPHCGGNILESAKGFFCENYKNGCQFTMFKDNKVYKLSKTEAKTLCAGKHIEKTINYNGKTWTQELYYNIDEHKVKFFMPEVKQITAKCPICSKELKNSQYSLECDCGFKLNRRIAEYNLTEKDISNLLTNGKTDMITKFYSKKKKKYFSALLVLSGKDIKFEF